MLHVFIAILTTTKPLTQKMIEDMISLLASKTTLGKQVDFIIGKFGCVYIDEHDMNGEVNTFLPRILALKYQEYYDVTNDPNNNLLNSNNNNQNKNNNRNRHRKAPKKVRRVYNISTKLNTVINRNNN